ncbi:MAG: hypothetical protein ACFFAH_10835 [Promethearchaeota archaeon]
MLDPIDIADGIFSLCMIFISTTIGLIIASKYKKTKQKNFLFVGIAAIGLTIPWLSSGISFLVALQNDVGLSPRLYFIIGITAFPFTFFCWLIAFTDMVSMKNKKKKQMIILICWSIFGAIYEILLIYYIIFDPRVIGELRGPVDVQYKSFVSLSLIIVILLVLITGIIFARESLRSDKPEIKLRGKFILAAFISYPFGAIADAVVPLNFITLPIIRVILISAFIELYIGFIMPDWIKKILLKEE